MKKKIPSPPKTNKQTNKQKNTFSIVYGELYECILSLPGTLESSSSEYPTQVAIVGVNVFYFVRIIRGTDASKGQSGYASFPEGSSSDQPYQGDEGDKQYAPPEY